MKNRLFIISICTFFLIGFKPLNGIQKKIDKEIKSTFSVVDFSTTSIKISKITEDELPVKMNATNFKKITNNDELLGYYFVGKAFGKVDYFDFLVVFDTNLIIKKVKIIVYREDRGGEISSKRWLKQFVGKSVLNSFVFEKDIVGISGATISAKSMTNQMEKLMQSIQILSQNKVL